MHEDRTSRTAFLAGVVTSLGLVAMLLAFVGWRVGFRELLRQSMSVFVPGSAEAGKDDDAGEDSLPPLPSELLRELVGLGGVIDNARNPTGARDHDTLLVRPDARRTYVLRPSARVDAYVLATGRALNLDPPVLYLRPGSPMSAGLRSYLERQTRLRYSISVNDDGFRATLPAVASSRKLLMVGDSVLFGVGVNDDATLASALQALVGPDVQVINAGVGEYGTEDIYRTAEALSEEGGYDGLVYVACQNDFDERSPDAYLASATWMLERLSSLAPRVGGRVAVLLHANMEYTSWDVLQEAGWTPRENALIDHLRAGLPSVARRLGFAYVDWAERVARAPQEEGTLFHRFALYVDHVHFSPLGNRLAARELHGVLAQWGLGGN